MTKEEKRIPHFLLRRVCTRRLSSFVSACLSTGLRVLLENHLYSLLLVLLEDPDVGVSSDASKALLCSLDYAEGVEAFFQPSSWRRLYTRTLPETDSVSMSVLVFFPLFLLRCPHHHLPSHFGLVLAFFVFFFDACSFCSRPAPKDIVLFSLLVVNEGKLQA